MNQGPLAIIQESIRRGHDDLGDHFLDSGDLANALKCYRYDYKIFFRGFKLSLS